MQKLVIGHIKWEVIATPSTIPVRGNCMDSGDKAFDKECEDTIMKKRRTSKWTWCDVEVKGTFAGLTASTYLGACSYNDKHDFTHTLGYYQDMQREVLADLQGQLDEIVNLINALSPA